MRVNEKEGQRLRKEEKEKNWASLLGKITEFKLTWRKDINEWMSEQGRKAYERKKDREKNISN